MEILREEFARKPDLDKVNNRIEILIEEWRKSKEVEKSSKRFEKIAGNEGIA